MTSEHPLIDFLLQHRMLTDIWSSEHAVFRGACPLDDLLTEKDIQNILDSGLLRWPYFNVLKHGEQPELTSFTTTRIVAGQRLKGFASPEGVREHLADGATMKLSQLEDWHRPIRDLMRRIEAFIPAELKAYIFYTPCDGTGMLPHRDGSHVLAVQIAGAKEWRIYDEPQQSDARAGLNVDLDSHSHAFVMEPGDVLYLPHGMPHVATARGGTSLHLTFTLTEPGPADLAAALRSMLDLTEMMDLPRDATVEDRAGHLIKGLQSALDATDDAEWNSTALDLMRTRVR